MEAWIRSIGLKGLFGGLGAAAVLYLAAPIFKTMAMGAAFLGITIGIVAFLVFFAPVFGEMMSLLAQWCWDSVIRNSPIQRLENDLAKDTRDLAAFDRRITEVAALAQQQIQELNATKNALTPEEYQERIVGVNDLRAGIEGMRATRDILLANLKEFERKVNVARLDLKLGRAMKSATGLLAFGKKTGAESQGAKISIDQVSKELAEGRVGLQLALTQDPLKFKALTTPQLVNKPIESLDFSRGKTLTYAGGKGG